MADAQCVSRPVIDQAGYRGDRAENPRLFANNPIANRVSVKTPIIAALIAFGLVACESSTPIVSTQTRPTGMKTIQIIADSPGVRIEVNDDYVGDAPVSITVPTDGAKFTKVTIIRATPTFEGEYVQSKHFDATSEVPSRILFNMGLGHAL
jgi:hypothetical protein